MRFGAVPLAEAEGAVLAHSAALPDGKLGKGRVLNGADLARLEAAGVAEVVVARLGPGDVPEDEAAARVAAALAPDPGVQGLTVTAPFTGRVNLYAAGAGVLTVETARIDALNALDEAVTVATLADRTRVAARQMLATVKIIPYAAPAAAVEAAEALAAGGGAPLLGVRPIVRRSADLILTRTPGMADKVIDKGAEAVRQRLAALGVAVASERVVLHETGALAGALAAGRGAMTLVLTASATSDRADTGPAAVVAAGGRIERFGMPVDPGNLLFLGRIGARPVIGLPGCARSPKLNGADLVLERVAAGLDPTGGEIAGMGVGGLLMEIPARPLPRAQQHAPAHRPRVGAVILAAGGATRMRGRDKLLEPVGDQPLLARVAAEVTAAG
ncbi:MAG TPA: NTP transferase domain-containing protein, partial [Thermohalobaculum sp.]|nr:NTP transferase domain-containing protein [Thermohalobaculum sp.]